MTEQAVRTVLAEGTVSFLRSDRGNCICCEGPHVYSVGLAPPLTDLSLRVSNALRQAGEGAAVRLVVEVTS